MSETNDSGSGGLNSHARKTVAVDLDGVLAQYDGWKGVDHIGQPIAGARDFLQALHEHFDILIYTTRCCEEINPPEKAHLLVNRVRKWLDDNEMPYDDIWDGQGKPIYIACVDDRAVACTPQNTQFAYATALRRVRALAMGFLGTPGANTPVTVDGVSLMHVRQFCGLPALFIGRTPAQALDECAHALARRFDPSYDTSRLIDPDQYVFICPTCRGFYRAEDGQQQDGDGLLCLRCAHVAGQP